METGLAILGRGVVRSAGLTLLLAVASVLAAAPRAGASPRPTPQEETPAERQARLDAMLLDADVARSRGQIRTALEGFERLAGEDPASVGAWRGLAECRHALGLYEEEGDALSGWLAAHPGASEPRTCRAEWLAFRGRLAEAESLLRVILEEDADDFRARADLGRLLDETGRREEARAAYRVLADFAATHVVEDAPRLVALASAYRGLGGFEEAASALADAIEADRISVAARKALGDLLLEKYQAGDALREYRLALEIRADDPDLLAGLAQAYAFREQPFDCRRELARALAVNPSHVEALVLEARTRFENRDFAGAKEAIDGILAVNPRHREGLSLRATWHFLRNDSVAFETDCRAVLAVDPTYGRLYLTVAEVLGTLYRFADGLPFAERALELDPGLWTAHDVAGRFALNLGKHDEGIAHLRAAQKGDNFRYPWRLNMLQVATIYDEFVTRPTSHFLLYLPVGEARVLREYLEDLLEECYTRLTRRYRFVPEKPTIVEVFPAKDDFAVRNVGMPGIDYILGVCFGRVVTLNSPSANPPGTFSWAQTAWHEFAHVLTLQITKARIPRWLTEGISVYEEREANPIWVRRQEMELFNAYHNGKIFPLRELNWAFRTPRIGFAYFQGSLLVEYIEETRGFDAILEMLRLYGEDLETEEIILRVLEVSSDRFDREFREWVGRKVERIRVVPRYDDDKLREIREEADLHPDDAALQAKLAWAYSTNGGGVDAEAALGRALELDPANGLANLVRGNLMYERKKYDRAKEYLERALGAGLEDAFARLRLAAILEAQGNTDAAIGEYERAKSDFPEFVGPGNPYTALERLYRARGDEARAFEELRELAELDNTEIRARRELAKRYRADGDLSRALRYLVEILWVDPFDSTLHVELADLYGDLERRQDEAKELGIAVEIATEAPEKVRLLVRLAGVEQELGRIEQARDHLERALRLDPGNAEVAAKLEGLPSAAAPPVESEGSNAREGGGS